MLWADDRSPNLGVRALAHGTAALVRSTFPGADVDFQSVGAGAAPVPIGSWKRLLRERVDGRAHLQDWLRSYDIVIDTRSGDSFADIYGRHRLATMTMLSELVGAARVPLVLGPQTIGPFETWPGRVAARRTLRQARLVMARDPQSADASRKLGRPVDVLTTDVVFGLPDPGVEKSRDVVLNVSGLLWNPGPHVDSEGYRATVTDLRARLEAQGRHVTLLAHVIGTAGRDNDTETVERLAAQGSDVVVPCDLDDVRRVVASARLVIGSRMHACLNALSVGTPAIPLAYSRKFAPLLAHLGWTATVDLRTSTDPVGEVLRFADDTSLADDVSQLRVRAAEALTLAGTALRGAL